MKTKPEQLKLLLESIEYPHLMDVIDTCWYIEDDTVMWNSDDNLKDLFLENGETCSGYLPEGVAEWEGYTVANYDTGCGQWVTMLLNNEKQVSLSELEEEFG